VRRAAVDVQDTLATGGVEGFEFGSSRVVVEELSSAMCISITFRTILYTNISQNDDTEDDEFLFLSHRK
jgi:hypothetical protein